MKRYTASDVITRIDQAAHTIRRLPRVTVQGYVSYWPEVVLEACEAYGYNTATVHLGPPSARHITEMDEAMRWLLALDKDELRVVWLRANNARWKTIERMMGWSIRKLQYDWRVAVTKITHGLNNPQIKTEPAYKKLLFVKKEENSSILSEAIC